MNIDWSKVAPGTELKDLRDKHSKWNHFFIGMTRVDILVRHVYKYNPSYVIKRNRWSITDCRFEPSKEILFKETM